MEGHSVEILVHVAAQMATVGLAVKVSYTYIQIVRTATAHSSL